MSNKFEQTSFLFGSNAAFIEELYQLYLSSPASVDPSWQKYFQEFSPVPTQSKSTAKIIGVSDSQAPSLASASPKSAKSAKEKAPQDVTSNDAENSRLRAKLLISAYRSRGHYLATLDPLGLEVLKTKAALKLNIEDFGFSIQELGNVINIKGEFDQLEKCTLSELITLLDQTYATNIAPEFAHVEDFAEATWLYEQIENSQTRIAFSADQQKEILKDLSEIEGLEQYLHTKFPGAKRFSVEGGEASMSSLITAIDMAANGGVEDIVIGMAHRGRLCTLTKVMGKPYRALLSEFMGGSSFPTDLEVSGDVKYHMGYSTDKVTAMGHKVHLSICPNPSHLEAVNPVVAGRVRAKQDLINDNKRQKVLGILVHGDAAFCGQGVVAESLVMSGLDSYNVGGILHLVINNQIGFTANTGDTHPGRYCTEVAKMVGAPILHVNGDSIESVLIATRIASDYRLKFGKDVVLDIICYRKYGHNEGDEPMYTQGVMYNIIKTKLSPATIYAHQLVDQKVIDTSYFDKLKADFKQTLDQEYERAKTYKPEAQWLQGAWAGFVRSGHADNTPTGVNKDTLKTLGQKLCQVPKDFAVNAKLTKLFELRSKTLSENGPLDWATAEQLAFASLLNEGTPIRFTGQDCARGTFSHRHSVLHSQIDYSTYIPLNNISKNQAKYFVADSNLSEYGVLGFEYGYSLVSPKNLVMWEAQFGDFSNGAQIIFDQFITSAETKWLRLSGLVVLLPHAYEGQGPEHSSARLERFLQMSAEDNIQVVYPTTPASIFHLLRRQINRNFRKPLIVMTPKSLLRHKLAVSTLADLDEGTSFQPIIDETNSAIKPVNVKRVILCSGKIYYDLLEARANKNITDIALIRFEQLYPFAEDVALNLLTKYNKAKEFVWCQEEPKNMGAWSFIKGRLKAVLKKAGLVPKLEYIGRSEAASPAAGSMYLHNKQQEVLINQALGINK